MIPLLSPQERATPRQMQPSLSYNLNNFSKNVYIWMCYTRIMCRDYTHKRMELRNQNRPAIKEGSSVSRSQDGKVPMGQRVKAAYGHFAETTTFGGAIHTFISPHWIWRAVWVLVVLFLIGATVWNTNAVIVDYLGYPVTTSIEVADQPSIPFPTVTVCNRNPISCSKLAYAYLKYPEELNDLMFYSNCNETLTKYPLLGQLLFDATANSSHILAWRRRVERDTRRIINTKDIAGYDELFRVGWGEGATDLDLNEAGKCAEYMLTGSRNTQAFDVILTNLIVDCGSLLNSELLFPNLHVPFEDDNPKAANSTSVVLKDKGALKIGPSSPRGNFNQENEVQLLLLGDNSALPAIGSRAINHILTSDDHAFAADPDAVLLDGVSFQQQARLGRQLDATGTGPDATTEDPISQPATTGAVEPETTSVESASHQASSPTTSSDGDDASNTGDSSSTSQVESRTPSEDETTEETLTTTPWPDNDNSSSGGTDFLGLTQNGPIAEEVEEMESFIAELSSIAKNRSTLHLLKELLEGYDKLILSCTYFGRDCLNETEFVLDFVPDYGSCFSFNSDFGKKESKDNSSTSTAGNKRSAFLTGSLYGLTMELWIDEEEYLPNAAASGAGARVSLTAPGTRPNPADAGFFVKPASEGEFAYRVINVARQPDPFVSHCHDSWGQTPFVPLNYMQHDNSTQPIEVYTYSECRLMCSTRLLVDECKCLDPRKTQPFKVDGADVTEKYDVCDITNKTQEKCRLNVLRKMQKEFECDCHLPCSDLQFVTSTSTARWPTAFYLGTLFEKYTKQSSWFNNTINIRNRKNPQTAEKKNLANNLVKINVFAQSMTVETISEQPKYDFSQALSALGGALGLYTGFCGITLFEIVELAIILTFAFGGYAHEKIEDGGDIGDSDDDDEEGQQVAGTEETSSGRGSAANRGISRGADGRTRSTITVAGRSGFKDGASRVWPQTARLPTAWTTDPPKPGVLFKGPPGVYVPESDPAFVIPRQESANTRRIIPESEYYDF